MINTLPTDYLFGAKRYVFVAKKACSAIPPDTIERMMLAAAPLNFMLGHAAELLLKSALAFKGYDEKKLADSDFRHNLTALKEACQREEIFLLERFVFWIDIIAKNHKDFDFRYPRSFGGFPEKDHARLLDQIGNPSVEAKKEIRKYGLVTTSPTNEEDFICAIEEQIKIIVTLDLNTKHEDKAEKC